jgi:hypothetical protein
LNLSFQVSGTKELCFSSRAPNGLQKYSVFDPSSFTGLCAYEIICNKNWKVKILILFLFNELPNEKPYKKPTTHGRSNLFHFLSISFKYTIFLQPIWCSWAETQLLCPGNLEPPNILQWII